MTARQSEGKAVNWVLPGPRRLSRAVFGTPENPFFGDDLLQHVKTLRPEVADLLDQFPIVVAVPEEMRKTTDDGSAYTTTTMPTPFSDRYRPTAGSLQVTYHDRQPWGGFDQANDAVDLDAEFTDPAGNSYTITLDRLDDRMFGGVMAGGRIHGNTGIGSPLMPQLYNYGSFWAAGTLEVNDGERTWENHSVHFMTTQMVRDIDYSLALDEDMPLDEPYLGRTHHTHGFVRPYKLTEQGPEFRPLDIPFPPDRDQGQPFVHIMYDQDEVSVDAG